ncbi:hypothetical protein ASPCAL05344 [Aspergillus calidoustus]|uniref:Uncharacterized protein n=1 Tax=Aspergillus calidoustus TaxID=454130 RepID=A0A0U4Z3H8_ASPCI|nr:hypothetical protein ASPCAL05344 [Aspergillus calidoustus]
MAEAHTKSPFSRTLPERLRAKPKHKNIQKARLKHGSRPASPPPPPFSVLPPPQDAASSPFLTRFFALPTEIRLQIYRLLLVRPCKFDLTHKFGCHTGIVGFPAAIFDDLYYMPTFRCADCATWRWRTQETEEALSTDTPARSAWARPKRNPYLCDRCYPEMQYRLGLEKWPHMMEYLHCLCARRENLGVLLINRRIYDEAWPIFWAENTFAFESGRLIVDFLEEIPEEKRARIRSIALLSPKQQPMGTEEEELRDCWPLLRACTGLRELELDAGLLNSRDFVRELRTLRAGKVRFIEKSKHIGFDSYDQGYRERKVTPWLAYRREYTDELSELLVTSMTQEVVDEEPIGRAWGKRPRIMPDEED